MIRPLLVNISPHPTYSHQSKGFSMSSRNILVINSGSSSIKFALVNEDKEQFLIQGLAERLGTSEAVLNWQLGDEKHVAQLHGADHKEAFARLLPLVQKASHGQLTGIGHRVVHGGERFADSVLITQDVLKGIEACAEIAPLHNPPNLHGINACMEIMPTTPQVAVFDTAFHQTLPKVAYLYGLPYELYVKYGLRRYGFHGTSHKYVAQVAASMMQEHMTDLRIITCHLGNGASITAIKYGKSIDTSMGYTPLEGLIMGTRSGEIDPAIIPFLMEKENMTAPQIDDYLNRRSGILGISGLSSDFRDLESAANRGDERSQLAIDLFAYKVKKYIGGYVAAMGGVDAIVFTAGVGENSPFMRDKICNGLEYLGTRIDPERNKVRGKAQEISVKRANVKIFVIPTNEELVIARDTFNICKRIIKL